MADTSLIFSIIARDKTGNVWKRLQVQASSTGKLIASAVGPSILPAAAAGTGAILGLGGALAGAGVAAGVFGGVLATSMTQVSENATKFEDLADKVELYGRQAQILASRGQDNEKMLKKQAAAALELEARLSLLNPAERAATEGFMQMKSDWQDFVDANQPATFNTLANGYGLLGRVILKLQPFFDMGRAAADRLLASLDKMVQGGGLERLAATAGPAMASLTSIIINVSTAVTRMFGKFSGEGNGVLDWLENVTAKWAAWASSTEKDSGINSFLSYVQTNGPQVVALLGQLVQAAVKIVQGISPLAPISLAIASGLASMVSALPPGVVTALVAGFVAFNVALKAYAIYQGIATAVTWAMNAAWLASPVTWIILAIVALVAVIVLVATKTRFFQTIWEYVWGFLKGVGAWFAGPFANFFVQTWNKLVASFNRAKQQFWTVVNLIVGYYRFWWNTGKAIVNRVISDFGRVVSFFRNAPGRIKSALSGMFNGLWTGFKAVVNRIIGGWNRLSFGIPGFSFAGISVPGISVGTPNLPYLAKGAGSVLQSGLAVIHRGETVTPAARVTPFRSTGGGGGATITVTGSNTKVIRLLLELLREGIRDQGGDPVKVLTPA